MNDLPVFERIPTSVHEALGHPKNNDFAIAMSNLVYAREASVGFEALTDQEKVVFCLDKLEQEVNNGGFEQYFRNPSGNNAVATPAALRALGAAKVASIVERALQLFPDGRPLTDSQEREAQMDAWDSEKVDALAGLDEAFLAYPEPLSQLERAYVQANAGHFRVPPGAGGSIRAI